VLHPSSVDYFVAVHCKCHPFWACSKVEHIVALSKLSCPTQVLRIYFADSCVSFGIRLPFALLVCQVLSLVAYLQKDMLEIIGAMVEDHYSIQIALFYHHLRQDLVLRIILFVVSLSQNQFCPIFKLCFC
jgi:hypothetical protein